MREIHICQYNCGEADHRLARPTIDTAAQQDPSIIFALQKPREESGWLHCPKTHIPHPHPEATSKLGFLMPKSMNPETWEIKATSDHTLTLSVQTAD
jgi:hypothetical protein